MGLNAVSEQPQKKNRRDQFSTLQKAIVEGTEDLWHRNPRTRSVALLWRAMHDCTNMEGLSVSVLCLGPLTGST
jgi:hypothetical protein